MMRIVSRIGLVVILILSRPILAKDAPAPVESFITAHLAGKVTDADGKPLRGARVFFNRATGAPMDLSPEALRDLSALTDGNGHYELTLRFRGGPLVVREVFADMEDFVRGTHDDLSIAVRAGDTAAVDFVLHPGQAVSGDVGIPLNEGQLEAGVRQNEIKHVLLVDGPALSGLTDNARAYTTQPGGHFAIYLPPGKYSLKVIDSAEPLELSDVTPGQRNLVITPEPFAWTDAQVGAAFDGFGSVMDANYSYFFLKKDVLLALGRSNAGWQAFRGNWHCTDGQS